MRVAFALMLAVLILTLEDQPADTGEARVRQRESVRRRQ
jgi:hypothetical protein